MSSERPVALVFAFGFGVFLATRSLAVDRGERHCHSFEPIFHAQFGNALEVANVARHERQVERERGCARSPVRGHKAPRTAVPIATSCRWCCSSVRSHHALRPAASNTALMTRTARMRRRTGQAEPCRRAIRWKATVPRRARPVCDVMPWRCRTATCTRARRDHGTKGLSGHLPITSVGAPSDALPQHTTPWYFAVNPHVAYRPADNTRNESSGGTDCP
jgi:hypothetical protein